MRGTTIPNLHFFSPPGISIHVPRAGDDSSRRTRRGPSFHFNPRPPCGGRPAPAVPLSSHETFQSTSPVRGTTEAAESPISAILNFNPRPPCGGRQQKLPETEVQFSAASAKTGARAGMPWGKSRLLRAEKQAKYGAKVPGKERTLGPRTRQSDRRSSFCRQAGLYPEFMPGSVRRSAQPSMDGQSVPRLCT